MAAQRSWGNLSRADAAVIASLCLLLVVLVPALLARPREQAVRRVCAPNLAQIGKAMLLYAGEYDGKLPRSGGPTTVWGRMPTAGWYAPSRSAAFTLGSDGSGGTASISSCFYLLVKYFDVAPQVFICAGDRGTTEFKLSDYAAVIPQKYEMINLWDFGPPADAYKHCSYSYHAPFSQYALTTSNDPNLAVAADRNPWIVSPAASAADITAKWATPFIPDVTGPGVATPGTKEQGRAGNAFSHQGDGQNVLFLDGRVEFATRAYCSLGKDNIYTVSAPNLLGLGDLRGLMPVPGSICAPTNRNDSLLVDDPSQWGAIAEKR